MENKEKKNPFHRRFGLRLLQILIIVLCLVLVKRCVDIYHENKTTDEQMKIEFFEKGFDIELVKHVREAVSIPVIASSGAGKVEHFSEVFEKTDVEAALAAGIFHREEVPIEAVKEHMREKGIERRDK